MSSYGYRTSVVCTMQVRQQHRMTSVRGNLVEISTDGAQVLCATPLPVGTTLTFTVEGHEMPALPARVVANEGDTGYGYRLGLKLTRGSFPYKVFVALSTLASSAGQPGAEPAATPPCLAELGLTLPCTVTDAEEAFDQRVRVAHPDRGGDVEGFVRLRSAYLEALRFLKNQS